MRNTAQKILADFDAAAPDYDRWAEIQAQTAQQLVAKCDATSPVDILDIGCGTGFVSESAAKKWPDATITALDHAPAMLLEAQRKVPRLKTILADAASAEITQKFDIIFSSMMLHWLPDPLAALKLWRTWLKPNGVMHIAFLTENSFSEWADLCRDDGVENGLWKMPPASLADATGATCEYQNIQISHPSAQDFLRQLKYIGAATPAPDHRPLSAARLRRVLASSPRPFSATYRLAITSIKTGK